VWEVTQRPLAITADDVTINYGQTPTLTYTITAGALTNGDVLSGALAVDNYDIGTHTITLGSLSASPNYAVSYTPGVLTVLNVDAFINDIWVNDIPADQIDNNTFTIDVECDRNDAFVIVGADPYATVTINGTPGNTATITLVEGENIIAITVTAQNGATENYTLIINRPVQFSKLVITRWENTMTVINNPANNGGYSFIAYKWYRDGQLLSTDQSWCAGVEGELIPAGNYYVVVETDNGAILRTCVHTITRSSMAVSVYPNPVNSGQMVTIDADLSTSQLRNAVVEVYTITGVRVGQVKVQGRVTTVEANYSPGVYLFVLTGNDGVRKDFKVVVQ
jgi:hypothetical protein